MLQALVLLILLTGTEGSSCSPKSSGLPKDSPGPASLLTSSPFSTTKATADVSKTKAHKVTRAGKDIVILTLNGQCNAFSGAGGWLGNEWPVDKIIVAAPADGSKLRSTDTVIQMSQFGTLHGFKKGFDPVWDGPEPDWWLGSDTTTKVQGFGVLEASWLLGGVDMGMAVVITNPVPAQVQLDEATTTGIGQWAATSLDKCLRLAVDELRNCTGLLTGDENVTDCMRLAAISSDPKFEPFTSFAVSLQRQRSIAEQMLNAYYSSGSVKGDVTGNSGVVVRWTKVLAAGNSKRGGATRDALALDPDVRGAISLGAAQVGLRGADPLQLKLWKGHYFPSYTQDYPALFKSPSFQAWEHMHDPARWSSDVFKGKVWIDGQGACDGTHMLQAPYTYAADFPNFRQILVPNMMHGIGAIDYVATARAVVASWLTEAAPSLFAVTARWNVDSGEVIANVTGASNVSVTLWCTTDVYQNQRLETIDPNTCQEVLLKPADDTDLRPRKWTRFAMHSTGVSWAASFPKASVRLTYPACIVRAQTLTQGVDWAATTVTLLGKRQCEAAGITPA